MLVPGSQRFEIYTIRNNEINEWCNMHVKILKKMVNLPLRYAKIWKFMQSLGNGNIKPR